MADIKKRTLPTANKIMYCILCLCMTTLTAPVIASPSADAGVTPVDPHAHHRMMMQNKDKYTRHYDAYQLPPKTLTDKNGKAVNLHHFLHSDKPFIISFIFTTCTTICPILTATLASAQEGLMASPEQPTLVSISIDPEVDTPDKLSAYAKKFKASEDWVFLTGKLEDIIEVQRALGVYRGTKLNHEPVTLMKAPNKKWLTLDGFTSANDLVDEYRAYTSND
ncbi:MAG TPA: SCO family protein [Gammaproteobacteria bacterium]|nr:SCO family protein [Gammaproteobacteria bacterium]